MKRTWATANKGKLGPKNLKNVQSKMHCDGCVQKMIDFTILSANYECLTDWLRSHGIFRREMVCPDCTRPCSLQNESFTCGRIRIIPKMKTKLKKSICPFSVSIWQNTWFDNSIISPAKLCQFVMYWAMLRPPRQSFLEAELKIDVNFIFEWSGRCRDVCVNWCMKNREKIGGFGVVVELDESLIDDKRYEDRFQIGGMWAYSGFAVGHNKMFFCGAESHSKESLLRVIKEWILPGSTIVSKSWKAFDCLGDEGFLRLKTEDRMNFLDPDTAARKQYNWKEVKYRVFRYAEKQEIDNGYLCEYLWKRTFSNYPDRLHSFFNSVGLLNSTSSDVDTSSSTPVNNS